MTISGISDWVWTYLLVVALVGCGIYFTVRTRGVQFTMIGEMFKLLGESSGKTHHRHISSFQAFAVGVATRVGTGNLAGVATAIAVGGPGAVFWMWVLALVGASNAFIESTLAQLFKRHHDGAFIGGPAYYISQGLKNHRMAVVFAVLLTLTFGLSYNSIQSNTICSAWHEAFDINPILMGGVLAAVALLIVFGGIRRIARFSSVIVPVMAIGYLLLTLVIVVLNIDKVPAVFMSIINGAFGIGPFAGGALGTTIMVGVKRGLFSNEAGEGSVPNVAATATVSHPVKQGLLQSLGVFADTLLVCSCTAFIILLSGVYGTTDSTGIVLTQVALQNQVGDIGITIVAIAIMFFAFSSIIGNYYYGEANIRFLTTRRDVLIVYRILSAGAMVIFGAVASLDLVWSIGDLFMALLTACNLIALVGLGRCAIALLKDYRAQRSNGVASPTFHASQMPELDLDAWQE